MDLLEREIEKARQLVNLNRYEQAITELMRILPQDPENVEILALLTASFIDTRQNEKALDFARKMVGAHPDVPLSFYYLSLAHDLNGNEAESEEAIREAIELDPEDPDYFACLSGIYIDKTQWEKALEYAETGLALDPEHMLCLNHRTMCLTKLNRKEDIRSSIEETLEANPNYWHSHQTVGWTYLEMGEIDKAKNHFREALMLNPNSEGSREGLKNALKAENRIYKLYLDYLFWMATKGRNAQGLIIIGVLLLRKVLFSLGSYHPIFHVLGALLLIAAFATWILGPLGDFFLMMNPFGRLMLKKEEKEAGVFTGIGFFSGLVLVVSGLLMETSVVWQIGAVFCLMTLPGSQFLTKRTKPQLKPWKKWFSGISIPLAAVFIGLILFFPTSKWFAIYLVYVAIYTLVENFTAD